jgi:hypothetical protein
MGEEVIDDLQPLTGTALDSLGDGGVDDDSDMMAGYEGAGGGEGVDTVAREPMKDANSVPEGDDDIPGVPTAAKPKPTAAPTAAAAPEKIGDWTVAEVRERFAAMDAVVKGHATVAGTVGNLKQRLDGEARQLTAADFPGVVEEFGEQYATALANDFNKVRGLGVATQGPSKDELEALISTRASEQATLLEQKLEKKAVLRAHKDADDHFTTYAPDGSVKAGAKAEAFHAWVGALPQDRQSLIANSWDSDVMIQALADFKTHEKAQSAPAGGAAASRQKRLERAATPQGSGAGAPVAEDDLAAGYDSAKGRR